MKKLAAAILLLTYFMVSTGFVVSVHYCMDELDSIELGDATDSECNQCGMIIKDSNGCCKDEVKVMKMKVDQTIAKLVTTDFSLPLILNFSSLFLLTPLVTDHEWQEPVAHGPPLNEQDTYLHNRVFRI
jgi:hypothetical protein